MTDRLEDLIQRWREQSATDDEPWAAQALSQCADELSAVLRAEAPRPLEDQDQIPDTRGGTQADGSVSSPPHQASGDSSALSIGEEHRLLKIVERVVSEIDAIVNNQPFADVNSFAVERIVMSGLREASAGIASPEPVEKEPS